MRWNYVNSHNNIIVLLNASTFKSGYQVYSKLASVFIGSDYSCTQNCIKKYTKKCINKKHLHIEEYGMLSAGERLRRNAVTRFILYIFILINNVSSV